METRAQRLDALPVTKKHYRLLLGSGIGWALDAMDVGLISFIMAALVHQWALSPQQASWLATAGFVGMAIGAAGGGLLANRLGRRHVFALTLLVYGLATGASALATGLGVLIALRFIVGLGLGAELPVASTLIAKFSPRSIRARMIVFLEAFWALGWLAAALIGRYVVTIGDNGWHWALALGMIPAFYSYVIRRALPESVTFLESKGRHDEAEAVVQDLEQAAREHNGKPAPTIVDDTPADQRILAATSIWGSELCRRTAALWTIWFCVNLSYYGAFIWIPTLLVGQGFDLVKSFQMTLLMTLAQLPGYAVAAWLIEVIGRRSTLSIFLVGSATAALLYASAGSEWAVIGDGCLLSFFNLGAWGALYAIGPDLYPTHLRGAGTGSAAAFGRIASIISPMLVPVVLNFGGSTAVFALFGAAFMVGACASWILPEQRGVALS